MSSLQACNVKLTSFSVRLNGRSTPALVFLVDIVCMMVDGLTLILCGGRVMRRRRLVS